MSDQNVEVVRRIYASWAPGSSPAESNLLHPDIEWINPSDALEPGTRTGIEVLPPVIVWLSFDPALTGAVALASSLAENFANRLKPAGQPAFAAAANCAENTGEATNAKNWQEQFRYALTGASSCN
jgi:hypothetical protein